MVLQSRHLFLVLAAALILPYASRVSSEAPLSEDDNATTDPYNITGAPDCVFGIQSCSLTIVANIQMILFYGVILGAAAKLISDGAEMLLDLGLPASIIGGIVLPLLGAIPDSAMIIASGSSGSAEEADSQIAVGMGTLAGSTIMLLTIPWFGALILGRVDIINGQGRDGKCSKFTLQSLWKSGVTVSSDVTISAIIMIVTALPYLIIQGADWHYGPTRNQSLPDHPPPHYVKYSAIATMVICLVSFVAYLVFQVVFSAASTRKEKLRRQERLKRMVVKRMLLAFQGKGSSGGEKGSAVTNAFAFKKTAQPAEGADSEVDGESGEKKALLGPGLQRKYFQAWRVTKQAKDEDEPEADPEKHAEPESKLSASHDSEEKEVEDPKWKIAIKCFAFLIFGVGLVTFYSDPMVDALTRLVDDENAKFFYVDEKNSTHYGQYIPIPVFYLSFVITPICSNASELVSSLIFAAKKKKEASSMTFSQLYGAATMNNTLCLGIFTALVAFRGLTWQYSAEVFVIMFVQLVMGILALSFGYLYKHTYIFVLAFPVFFLYFFSILLTWMLETFAGWK